MRAVPRRNGVGQYDDEDSISLSLHTKEHQDEEPTGWACTTPYALPHGDLTVSERPSVRDATLVNRKQGVALPVLSFVRLNFQETRRVREDELSRSRFPRRAARDSHSRDCYNFVSGHG